MGRWEDNCRRFMVYHNDGFQINCVYLDNGERFHTSGFQSLLVISVCWWMGEMYNEEGIRIRSG